MQSEIERVLREKGYVEYIDLSHGSKGDDVVALQERLTELGYYNGLINGRYDSETQKAVKTFQKDNGLKADGIASRGLQELLFSSETKAIVRTTKTPTPTATPRPTISAELAEYSELDYRECARYPEQYIGRKIVFAGKVLQSMGTKEKGFTLRVATVGSSNIVYVVVKPGLDFNILKNDRITVYATMTGTKTYRTILGASVTLPSANADYVELR